MPKRIDNIVRVTLPPKARKAYAQMEKEFLLRVDKGRSWRLTQRFKSTSFCRWAMARFTTPTSTGMSSHRKA